MSGMDTVWGHDHLERQIIWEDMIKSALQDDLEAQKLVRWIPDFKGGVMKIASVGEFTVDDIQEQTPVPISRPDTGQYEFRINQAIGTRAAYTDDFLEDDFLAAAVVNSTPEKMKRALDEVLETRIFQIQRDQGAGSNIINGKRHRFAGGGTNGGIEMKDFSYAKLALKKANVPMQNLVAFVTPELAYKLETMTPIVGLDSNPHWEGIVTSGLTTGMRYIRSIYGVDIYESNYLDVVTETIEDKEGNSKTVTDGNACVMFSAAGGDLTPFIGSWRRMPSIASWRDEELRTEYHQMTARFGLGLYRPENFISIISNDVNEV